MRPSSVRRGCAGCCRRRPTARFVDCAAGGRAIRRADRNQQPAARLRHAPRDNSGRGPLSRGRAGVARHMGSSASARKASRSASSGRATPIRRPTAPAPCRLRRSRRSPRSRACRLISLQKGAGEEQLANLPPSMRVETLGADFDAGADAFVDTAAAMTCLDLVVTCDTSIAHLAGALAVPVWVALKSDAEWRWLTGRARFALVSDHATLSPVAARRLARRVRSHGAGTRRARRAARGAAHDFDAVLARRTDRQDHDPAHQGRTHRRSGQARQRPARTGVARAPGARGRRGPDRRSIC